MSDSKPAKDIPALVPGIDMVAADKPQPPVDETAKKLYQDAEPATLKFGARVGNLLYVGSGYIEKSNGEAITNSHVVVGSNELFVTTSDGQQHQAQILDMDDIKDLAKIKVVDLSAAENHSLTLSSQPLEKGEKIWGLTHPHGSDELYISPGKFLDETSRMAKTLESSKADGHQYTAEQILAIKSRNLTAPEIQDIGSRLTRNVDFTDAHTEHGSSGGPFVNLKDEVTGLEVTGGKGVSGMVPLGDLRSFVDSKDHKYSFEYENQSSASVWMHEFAKDPSGTLRSELSQELFGAAGLASMGLGRYKLASLSLGILAANDLQKNYYDYKHSASFMMRAEAGIKMVGDSAALFGSAALMAPKVRLAGKLALAAGAAVYTAATFLPSHLILTKTTRVEGPDRPPTPFK